ncbi:MAG: electron transfer flavoprotein subunit alpha/FixB family protein [Saccharofermentanales bacterium]|nr:electron transfer flavoprotein subunit alpha/FixB family protein [Clostridiaceae bacterium]
MNLQDYQGVFVFIQQVDNQVTGVSYELLGRSRGLAEDLGTEVTAVIIGDGVGSLTGKLGEFGADRVVVVDRPGLRDYMTEPYTQAISAVVEKYKPAILLFGATAIGRDLAPRVSARVRTGLTADCTKLEIDPDSKNLRMTRPAFGGNIMATILCARHRPQMATVRPGVMQKIKPRTGFVPQVDLFEPDLAKNNKYVEILETVKKTGSKRDIQDARILVSGGRGVGCPDDFSLLEDLADALGAGAEVSSSRACVDAGWTEKGMQVGQTGKTVRPHVYFALGISGAIQHLAGMEESEIIVAINKDETAPIFDVADYGVVGDLHKILPILAEKIRTEKAARA